MASIASVLQILVQANADDATRKLKQFDDKMSRTRAEAARKIEAQLGANFDKRAFAEYDARLKATQDKVKNRAAFKAALGADFNPAAFNAYQRAVAKSESDTRRMSGSLSALEQRFTGGQNKVEGFNAAMMGLRNVVGLIRWPAMIAGAGLATQAVGALASGAIGLVSALAPLAGAGAAAAAGIVAYGQAVGVVKLATDGLKKALTGNKAALAALTPAQRALLTDLKAVKSQVKSLQDTAARGMTPGLEKGLRAVTPLFKVLRPIVAATAKELGNLAAVAGKTVGGWGKDLATVGKTNVGVIHNLGLAAISLGTAFKNVVVVAGPLLTWMSGLVKTGAAFIDKQVQAGRESGKLAAFLQQTRQVMSELGHVAMNLGVAFFNIGKAAAPLGRDLLQSLVKLTAKFREWTASASGQNKLATYFQNMKAPLYAIFGLVGDIGKALIQLSGAPGLTHVVNQLRTLVPVLKGVIGNTTQAFSKTFIDALANVVRLFGQLAGTSGPLNLLVRAIGWVAGAINSLLNSSPGMHAFVIDFVGFGAAVKALTFLPKLPFVGSLISLFTASGRAKSLASLLSLGGLRGGAAGGLAGKVSTSVATMEVGTLIVRDQVGGGAGGVAPGGGVGGSAEQDVKNAEKVSKTGKVIRFISHAGNLIPIIGTGAAAGALIADTFPHGINAPYSNAASQSALRVAGGAYAPGNTQAGAAGAAFIQQSAAVQQVNKDFTQTLSLLDRLANHQASVKQTAQAFDELAQKARKAGDVKWALADTLGSELVRTHNVASAGVQQLIGRLNTLAPGARTAAAQSMTQMTQMLETQGQLPKGATVRLVTEMLQHYQSLKDKGGTYFSGLLSIAGDRLHALQQVAATTTGHAHDVAVREIGLLRDGVTAALKGAEHNTETQINKMASKIGGGTHDGAHKAAQALASFQKSVAEAMDSGVLSTNAGIGLITQALASALKAFGVSNVPKVFISKASHAASSASKVAGNIVAFAEGGMVKQAARGLYQIGSPGQSGRDNVPLNVGGTPIMVGAGEQVAVFNRHQQSVVNGALAPVGGLSGLFSKVSRPHYMASGGIVPYGGLESLWSRAGGPSNLAPLMAAIAEAESGGNPSARNPSGASGLWQILGLPFAGNPFDPLTNARMAVSKWRSQGLGAWVTYTSGAYRQFLGGANAGAGAGSMGAVPQITAPQVSGKGALSDITRAVLGKATAAANAYIARQTASFTGMGGVPGPPGGPTGVGTFQGLPVANWVIAALQYAQSKGVRFRITSGYRPGFDPHAPSGSEHAGTQYPHGAVDFGGMVDPAVLGEKLAVVNATRSFKWPLLAPIGFRDDGHASGTGHARGGFVAAFAGGGEPRSAQRKQGLSLMNRIWAAAHPYYPGSGSLPATHFMANFPIVGDVRNPSGGRGGQYIAWPDWMNQWLIGNKAGNRSAAEETLVHEWAHYFQSQKTANAGAWQSEGGAQSFTREHAAAIMAAARLPFQLEGKGDDVYFKYVQKVRRQLGEGWINKGQFAGKFGGGMVKFGGAFQNGGIVPGPTGTPTMILAHGGEVVVPHFATGGIPSIAQATGEPGLPRLGGKTPVKAAGAGRVQATITGLRSQIDGLEHQYGILDQFYNLSTETFIDPNTGLVDQAAVDKRLGELDNLIALRQKIFRLWGQVVAHTQRLVDSNRNIIGRLQKALNGIKTHGLKGKALASAQQHQSTLRSDIATYKGNLSSALGDLTSAGDDRDSAWISLLTLQGERAGVAGTQAQPVAAAATPDPSVALLQQLLTQSQQTLLVSQAQYSAFQSLPPFGGSFADGGVVPGPLGAARTIIAHGGETVGQGQPVVQVIIQEGAGIDPNKIQVIAENAAVKVTRGATALTRRSLPGSAR